MFSRALRLALLLLAFAIPSANAAYMYRSVRQYTVLPGGKMFFWFPKGLHDANPGSFNWEPPTVPTGWRWFFPLKTNDIGNWGRQFCAGIEVPHGTTPGNYSIDFQVTNEPPLTVTVAAPPSARPVFRATPADSQSEVQSRLNNGYDVELLPGVYVWSTWLDMPDHSRIFSAGAKIVRHWTGDPGTFKRVFHPLGHCTVEGLTLSHDESIPESGYESICYFHAFRADLPPSYGPPGYTTIRDCVIERGSLANLNQSQCLIERCSFPRSSIGHLPKNSAILDCDFSGRAFAGQHAFLLNDGSDCFVGSLRFNNTTRGIILQNHYVRGSMFADIDCHNIRGGESYGSNECLLLETPWGAENPPYESMSDNLFLDFRMERCSGPGVSLYGDGIRNNRFINFDIHVDKEALLLASLSPGGVLGRNEWSNIEAHGVLSLHGTHEPNRFENLNVLRPEPMRGNQGPWGDYKNVHKHWPFDLRGFAGFTGGSDHEFSGFTKAILPEAVVPLRSVRNFQTTTSNGTETVLYWIPVGWDYAENQLDEANFCEVTVGAINTGNKSEAGTFVRRCKIVRNNANPAVLYDQSSAFTSAPSAWLVSLAANNDRLEIRVTGEASKTIDWRILELKWQRIY